MLLSLLTAGRPRMDHAAGECTDDVSNVLECERFNYASLLSSMWGRRSLLVFTDSIDFFLRWGRMHRYQILFRFSFPCRRSVALSLPRQGVIRLMQLTLIAVANRSRVTQTCTDYVAVYLGVVSRDAITPSPWSPALSLMIDTVMHDNFSPVSA
jgi:hypothetical protein